MELPRHDKLDTIHLQRLFDNMSECYKLFWFQAIVEQVFQGEQLLSFDLLINNMVADAWYMVTEYRLNLGPADNLEALVHYAQKLFNLKSSEKKETILQELAESEDRDLLSKKNILTLNVPYRLQAPFLSAVRGNAWAGPKSQLVERINDHPGLLYRIEYRTGLQSLIHVDDQWAQYIKDNYEIILGWIQFKMIQYLQRRNPSVPGIPNKIAPPQQRQMNAVTKYWKAVLSVEPMREIYAGIELDGSQVSIDHFIPWSYVAHDELWNLSPTTRSINSSKSNHLPDWDTYFSKLEALQFRAYELVWQYDKLHDVFEKCAKEHINSVDVKQKLYRPDLTNVEFANRLDEIVRPVYSAALNLGFDRWTLRE